MATVKVKFRPSEISGKEGTVFYQVIHERKVRQLNSGCRILASEWDARRGMPQGGTGMRRREVVLAAREMISRDLQRLDKIEMRLSAIKRQYTAEDIVEEYKRYTREYTLCNYMTTLISKLNGAGRVRTAETYLSALNSFRKFSKEADVMIDCLTKEIIEEYETWQRRRGVSNNTISFYNRILRSVYNRAVDQDITEDRHPFRRVYTGIDKTKKRAVTIDVLKKLKKLDLSKKPHLAFTRNLFMLSFCLRGMSFVDMVNLKKSDINKGVLTYRRRKTGQRLVIAWTSEMQDILESLRGYQHAEAPAESDYLLPIFDDDEVRNRRRYKSAGVRLNRHLKIISEKMGLPTALTMYVARHSWATAAQTHGIPLNVISEGMGHDNENTTRIYLSSIETSIVDNANSLILASLK